MGCDAAIMAAETIENAQGVAAMVAMATAKAVDILELQEEISPLSQKFVAQVKSSADGATTGNRPFSEALIATRQSLFGRGPAPKVYTAAA